MRRIFGIATLFSALFAGAAPAAVPRWDLNDVSILFPLPRNEAERARMILPDSPSDRGKTTLPASIYEELVKYVDEDSKNETARDALRKLRASFAVIAVRIDPCAREHLTDACEPQIRAVWQSVGANAAIHAIYKVDSEEWKTILATFARIRDESPQPTRGLPLGPHPGLVRSGLAGAYAGKTVERLRAVLPQSRLRQLTFTFPNAAGEISFRRFHVWEDTAVNRIMPSWITYSTDLEIRWANARARGEGTAAFRERVAGTLKTTHGQDDFRAFLADSDAFRGDRAKLVELEGMRRRIEDPARQTPFTTDCLSCHVAGALKPWLARELGKEGLAAVKDAEWKAPAGYDVRNASAKPGSPVRLRALGYEGSDVAILDRTIFESAWVAEALNSAN